MRDKDNQNKPKTPGGDASDIRVVRVSSNPGPDAQDRLRRLFTLLVKYATKDTSSLHPTRTLHQRTAAR